MQCTQFYHNKIIQDKNRYFVKLSTLEWIFRFELKDFLKKNQTEANNLIAYIYISYNLKAWPKHAYKLPLIFHLTN